MSKPKKPSKFSLNPLYRVWSAIKQRCYNKNNPNYKHYGAKGITICDEWKHSFKTFESWSIENGYKQGLSIDRINSTKSYTPDNCRWIPCKEQPKNRQTNLYVRYNDKVMTIREFSRTVKCYYHTVVQYLYRHNHLDKYNAIVVPYEEAIKELN